MLDSDFLKGVHEQKTHFQHGTHIECTLKIEKKVDDEGNVIVARYNVIDVAKIYDGSGTDTIISKQKAKKSQSSVQQPTLFDINSIVDRDSNI